MGLDMIDENSLDKQGNAECLKMANAIRFLAADAVQRAGSGHPGMPMGAADIATVLFGRHLKFCAKNPDWPDRDRFVLSAGHGSMLLYSLLFLTGFEKITMEQIQKFRQWGSLTPGHPEHDISCGVEATTGPLGQGLATAVGMALAERVLAEDFGADIVDHHTYVLAGDGCLMEGISQEAISFAGHMGLGKLIVLWDDNRISIDGAISLCDSTDQQQRFCAVGWNVLKVDGHDHSAVDEVLSEARCSDRPTLIACRTIIGCGAPNRQGTAGVHGAPLGGREIEETRRNLGWEHPPFVIPDDILQKWRQIGHRSDGAFTDWQSRFDKLSSARKKDFSRRMERQLPPEVFRVLRELKLRLEDEKPTLATRKASQTVLSEITPVIPELLGGSADLTGSNLTWVEPMKPLKKDDFQGRYIHYGIREHFMGAAMNGITLHGGFRCYGGTFLTFSDYARPSIRLSALMGCPVVYVMSHDSIGLGEDGPTHQPVEHLAILRATPRLQVLRPADSVETLECWELALKTIDKATVLILSRQNLPALRGAQGRSRNLCAQGAYVLAKAENKRKATIIGTGSEVSLAIAAKNELEKKGIGVQVVSMPSHELFSQQTESYQRQVLPRTGVRVAVEAATRQGWDRWLCAGGLRQDKTAFIGVQEFGASASAAELYSHFGLTVEGIVETVMSLLSSSR